MSDIAKVLEEMRTRRVNHGKSTSPTLIAWADRIEAELRAVQGNAVGAGIDFERVARKWCSFTDTPFNRLSDAGRALCVQHLREAVLAATPAAQEAVAVVSAETYNSDGTSDIIKPALPIGTKLYAAPVAAAPGIDPAALRQMLDGWKNSDYPFSYEGQCAQKALNACIADVEGLLIDASPKGGSDAPAPDYIDTDNGLRRYPWTYQNQPGNLGASVLGACARLARPGGDSIDHGLSLLRELHIRGFGIVRVEKLATSAEVGS